MEEIKYNRGQKVFVVSSEPYYDTCDICKGKKEIKLKGRSYTCPECDGSGRMYVENTRWRIFEGTVKSIYINEAGAILYTVCSKSTGHYYNSIDESNIFLNKKFALAERKKREKCNIICKASI